MRKFLLAALAVLVVAMVFAAVALVGQHRSAARKSPQEPPILPAPTSSDFSPRTPFGKQTKRIVGGTLSPGLPFLAAILYENRGARYQYCGATVIDDRWLLTAAHCDVRQGDWAIINRANLTETSSGLTLRVERAENHPAFNRETYDNDIALLQLGDTIGSAIPRVVLSGAPAIGTEVTAAGWGATAEGGRTVLQLRQVNVPLVDADQCAKSYPTLTANQLCAGDATRDACQGDSGGPLFTLAGRGARQYGVTSVGKGCGRPGFPGIYTRVERYTDWIQRTMTQPPPRGDGR